MVSSGWCYEMRWPPIAHSSRWPNKATGVYDEYSGFIFGSFFITSLHATHIFRNVDFSGRCFEMRHPAPISYDNQIMPGAHDELSIVILNLVSEVPGSFALVLVYFDILR